MPRHYMRFEPSVWVSRLQRISASMIAPSVTAMVALAMTMWLRPGDQQWYVAAVASAPYLLVALAVLMWHNPREASVTIATITTISIACNLLLVIVMYYYWTSGRSGEDFMWPVTNIIFLSMLYGLVFAGAFVCIAISKIASRFLASRRGRHGHA